MKKHTCKIGLEPTDKLWKLERTNAWFQNFRRVLVRFDHKITMFGYRYLGVCDDHASTVMKPLLMRLIVMVLRFAKLCKPSGIGNMCLAISINDLLQGFNAVM